MREKKAIILDRDGTLIEDTNYAYKIEDLEILPGVIEGLKLLQKEFLLFIVTNQSGIGRGYYTENNFHVIELLASTVVSRYIIVLHFVQNKENQTILICRDALFYDEFRKLMVALKISGLNKG